MAGHISEHNAKGPDGVGSDRKKALEAIRKARTEIVMLYPFYGSILMNLRIAFANCGTAATDMQRLIFDPEFVLKLKPEELQFVMLHEVMHNVLKHCIRCEGKILEIYNVAADIVVNSNIMKSMGSTEFSVADCPVEHKAPDGTEGYEHSAEEVYEMLLKREPAETGDGDADSGEPDGQGDKRAEQAAHIDRHDIWQQIKACHELSDEIDRMLKQAVEAARMAGSADIPMSIRDMVGFLDGSSRVNWRELLHDFVQLTSDRYDYSFNPVDRRFTDSGFFLPAFREDEVERVENIWFVVDTSGSIDDETLGVIYTELRSAIQQFDSLSGRLSFFDTMVTAPVEFDDVGSLADIKPVGGGGTSFIRIFEYLADNMQDDPPVAIVILTDGCAAWPEEEMSMGVPVMWIVVDTGLEAPWGTTVNI